MIPSISYGWYFFLLYDNESDESSLEPDRFGTWD